MSVVGRAAAVLLVFALVRSAVAQAPASEAELRALEAARRLDVPLLARIPLSVALREGGDEGDLLPVALGVGAAPLARVELEALQQVGLAPRVQAPAGPRPSRTAATGPAR